MSRELTKEELRRPDEFVGFFEKLLYQLGNRKKHIFSALLILLLVVGASFLAESIFLAKDQKAANEFAKVMEKLPTAFQQKEDWKPFLDEINLFVKNYSRSSILPVAYLYKGKAEFGVKQFSDALNSYQIATRKLKPPYRYLAMEGEAITQMELEHWDQANVIWQDLSTKKDNPLRDFHLYNLALVQEHLGHTEQAKETYQLLEKDFPTSSYVETAKLKMLSMPAK